MATVPLLMLLCGGHAIIRPRPAMMRHRVLSMATKLQTAPDPDELLWSAPQPETQHGRRRVWADDDPVDDVDFELLDKQVMRIVSQVSAVGPAVTQFAPDSLWLWSRWRNTVLEQTWQFLAGCMTLGTAFVAFVHLGTQLNLKWLPPCNWPLLATPLATHPLVAALLPLNAVWSMQVTLTTFIVTFFLSKAYDYWRISYKLGRSIQGRLQDINLMLATHLFRDATGEFTPESRSVLEDTARHIRLLHALFWVGIDDSLSLIRTDRGLRRLVERGLMSEREHYSLTTSGVPHTARHNVVIGWILARTVDARAREVLEFGAGTESVFVNNILMLRAKCNSVPDEAVARMPLAYVHLVQLLVDSLVVVAPIALYPQVGSLCVPLSGLLVIFFRGLLNLSKALLDPFGNAFRRQSKFSYKQTILTDALISEVNAASTRWWRGAERLPFDTVYTETERQRYKEVTLVSHAAATASS